LGSCDVRKPGIAARRHTFGVQSIDRQTLKNNVVAPAKAAKVLKVILMAINNYLFSGIAQQCGWVQ
jgi:hypothetical protein